jgi:hypothetical protein
MANEPEQKAPPCDLDDWEYSDDPQKGRINDSEDDCE